jgi:hypothetical protein
MTLTAAALCATAVLAAATPESFTATASVKRGTVTASAPVTVTVNQYATDAEREAAKKAVRDGGTKGLRTLLAGKPDVGFIQLGDRKTPVKIAIERATSGGRLITAITAEPILYLGSKIDPTKPVEGFDLAIAMFEVQTNGPGVGDLSPAAKIALDDGGAVVVQDYGATVVWLNGIARAK